MLHTLLHRNLFAHLVTFLNTSHVNVQIAIKLIEIFQVVTINEYSKYKHSSFILGLQLDFSGFTRLEEGVSEF